MNKKFINSVIENIKVLIFALIIAIIIRSLLFQPFYIPSSSMEPNLLIGDRIFVSKYSYGYSKHSFPFSFPLFSKRIFSKNPTQGDLVVFKTPSDNRTDYIKRLIGLPGDEIQFIEGELFINNIAIKRIKLNTPYEIRCGSKNLEVDVFNETLPNGKSYIAVYRKKYTMLNTDNYIVPKNNYFLLGDNRDCSKDSRFLSSVGYVNKINLVGKAQFIFFSNDTVKGSILKIWKWRETLRINRFFSKL
jgi:signal peptidase I